MKTIFTVQHTESEHHINGHIGAGYDWPLTARGRDQAFRIGKWLKREIGELPFRMFVSPKLRALQTAEEINRTLVLNPEIRDELREVDAGQGNGKTREWYRENEAFKGPSFDPDYRPFPDAESDRDLWNRLEPFYHEIMESKDEHILIISHGGALSFLQSMLIGHSVMDRGHFCLFGSSGSVSHFFIADDGKVTAYYINHHPAQASPHNI